MGSTWEKLQVDGNEMRMYTGMPDSAGFGNGPFPAVVVAQPAGGVDEFLQTIVDRLAAAGYAAAAPDLFHRTTPEIEQATGKTPRQLLVDPQVVVDINATVDFDGNACEGDGGGGGGGGIEGDVKCDDFAGGVIDEDVDGNVEVDTDCTVASGVTIDGNMTTESGDSHSITLECSSNFDGNIENKGNGDIVVCVGDGDLFNGNIKDDGDGSVTVVVEDGGHFNGNTKEEDDGDCTNSIDDFDGNPCE